MRVNKDACNGDARPIVSIDADQPGPMASDGGCSGRAHGRPEVLDLRLLSGRLQSPLCR